MAENPVKHETDQHFADEEDDDFEVVSPEDDDDDEMGRENSEKQINSEIVEPRNASADGSFVKIDGLSLVENGRLSAECHKEAGKESCGVSEVGKSFEAIRKELAQAKANLMQQQTLLTNSFASFQSQQVEKDKEIETLNSQLNYVKLENDSIKAENDVLKKDASLMVEYREKLDELTAKLLTQEEHQEQTVDGFVNVQPQILTDQLNQKDKLLTEKEKMIENLQKSLAETEIKMCVEKERGDNAYAIIDVLQDENREASRILVENRQRIESLTQQIETERDNTDVRTCERCHLQMIGTSNYQSHINQCSPLSLTVDNLD